MINALFQSIVLDYFYLWLAAISFFTAEFIWEHRVATDH